MKKKIFQIQASLWLYPGENASWHFITVSKPVSEEIRSTYGTLSRGWGSLPVSVTLGKTTWETSIFPDRKSKTYILPIKASVRRLEGVEAGDQLKITLRIRV